MRQRIDSSLPSPISIRCWKVYKNRRNFVDDLGRPAEEAAGKGNS